MKQVLLVLSVVLFVMLGGCASSPVNKDGVDTKKAAAVNAELGLGYMRQQEYEVALTKLKRALEYDPHYAPAHHYLGELYRRLERYDDADEHYREALDYTEGDASLIHNNYGAFLCSRDRFDDGIAQFQKVLDNPVYPRRDQVYENMGLCMERKADMARAEKYLRQALQLNSQLPKSLLAMGRISFAEKNYLSARAYLQRFQAVPGIRHTPESLWLGIRVERILGDKNALASYGLLLKSKFPDAPETKLYLESK